MHILSGKYIHSSSLTQSLCPFYLIRKIPSFSEKRKAQTVILRSALNDESGIIGNEHGVTEGEKAVLLFHRSGNYEWENFYKAVRSGGKVLDGEVSVSDIVNGICIVDAMKRSLKSGAIEEIKPY